MTLHEQLFKHITHLENQNARLLQALDSQQQSMEYICLKLGYEKWMLFMADVRANKIVVKKWDCSSETMKGKGKITGDNSLIEQILSARRRESGCESPIENESRIRPAKSDHKDKLEDSMSNESFKKSKDHQKRAFDGNAVQETLKTLPECLPDPKQGRKKFLEDIPFDTFRNPQLSTERESRQTSWVTRGVQFRQKDAQSTVKKESTSKGSSDRSDEEDIKGFLSAFEAKDNSLRESDNMSNRNDDQCILAMENTRLRRQIHELERIIDRKDF